MTIQDKVIDIIATNLHIDRDDVSPEKSLIEDLNADSLDLTELMMAIEEHFGFEIASGDAAKLRTVQDIINYIEKQSA